MPERLCGGTFRTRRGRKRKRGVKAEELSYAERQQRRIEKKFGQNGQQLGGEEETRVKLENGKKPKGKPRVAGSARGRELRAAAALARFGTQKEEEVKKEEATGASDSDSGSDFEDVKLEKEAIDLNGSKLLDGKGRGMVKVCEDENEDDFHVKQEMDELHDLSITPIESHDEATHPSKRQQPSLKHETDSQSKNHTTDNDTRATSVTIKHETSPHPAALQPKHPSPESGAPKDSEISPTDSSCPICSMANETSALVCVACSHVLQPRLMPGSWRCQSSVCQGSRYLNAGDCGICGVCGSSKPAASG
ncbi:MAG: hypothetical protein Q9199_008040 [Rusavskia elegans]